MAKKTTGLLKKADILFTTTGKIGVLVTMTILVSAFSLWGAGAPERTPSEQVLVTPEWIVENSSDLTIIDAARKPEDFSAGHIPGAVLANREIVWTEVNGTAGMLPDAESVAKELEALGVTNDKPVVVYDSGNGLWASRFFWALEYLGHKKAHLLDGGFAAWQESGNGISSTPSTAVAGNFKPNVQAKLLANRQYVLENLNNEHIQVIDTRTSDEFSGTDVRASRGGHIPGSAHFEWKENLDGNYFKPIGQLKDQYQDILGDANNEAVTLCQTGVRGAHSYVAIRAAGFNNVRLYDGSWADWGNDSTTPIDN